MRNILIRYNQLSYKNANKSAQGIMVQGPNATVHAQRFLTWLAIQNKSAIMSYRLIRYNQFEKKQKLFYRWSPYVFIMWTSIWTSAPTNKLNLNQFVIVYLLTWIFCGVGILRIWRTWSLQKTPYLHHGLIYLRMLCPQPASRHFALFGMKHILPMGSCDICIYQKWCHKFTQKCTLPTPQQKIY